MRRRKSAEDKIKTLIMRRRRSADRNAKRRAELCGAKIAVDISRDAIRERDKEMCHLCGGWVSVHDTSLDHVMPLAEGGDHTPENVKLAHGVCNSKKGARLVSELNHA